MGLVQSFKACELGCEAAGACGVHDEQLTALQAGHCDAAAVDALGLKVAELAWAYVVAILSTK